MKKWEDRSSDQKENIIALLFVFSAILIFVSIFYFGQSEYEVEVTYCDERDPKIVRVNAFVEPDQSKINTHDGVPKFAGEVYVCSIKTLRKIEQ